MAAAVHSQARMVAGQDSAPGSLGLARLESELLRTKAAVDSWAARQAAAAQDIKDAHSAHMKDQADKIVGLKDTRKDLTQQLEELQRRLAEEQGEVAALQSTSGAVRAEHDALRRQVAVLQDALASQQAECDDKEAEVAAEERRRAKRVGALKHLASKYATHLGLEFRQGPEELLLVLTQVDAAQPSREFKVAVRVQPDNTYKVTRCSPQVAALPSLLAHLNASNNFSAFIIALRTEFCALCGGGSGNDIGTAAATVQ